MYATPQQIVDALMREFKYTTLAIAYAEKIASMNGPLSPDYKQAAGILKQGVNVKAL